MRYLPDFLNPEEAGSLFQLLTSTAGIDWQTEYFQMFGKQVEVPRHVSWAGESGLNYRYTGCDHIAVGWPPYLARLRERVQQGTGIQFNYVLLNRYLHGAHHMGWHRDDETGARPDIASLSLGAVRRFRIRGQSGQEDAAINLASGSIIVFNGRHSHMLAKTRRDVGERINLTFRYIESEKTPQPLSDSGSEHSAIERLTTETT